MEGLGVFFVQYVRGPKGIPDAIPRMGRVFELVGRGRTFEQAFAQTYGFPLKQVLSEIVALFKRTEAHPTDRFKATEYEKYLGQTTSGGTLSARERGARDHILDDDDRSRARRDLPVASACHARGRTKDPAGAFGASSALPSRGRNIRTALAAAREGEGFASGA
jgi:hypothetical protein